MNYPIIAGAIFNFYLKKKLEKSISWFPYHKYIESCILINVIEYNLFMLHCHLVHDKLDIREIKRIFNDVHT